MKNLSENQNFVFKLLNLQSATQAQTNAIISNTPILVSASAGSGKTFTLCSRILFKLLSSNNESLLNLLVVSFTKLAATEIYNRIKNKLHQLIQQFPKNKTLKIQLHNLSQNNITTIDSFCSKLNLLVFCFTKPI